MATELTIIQRLTRIELAPSSSGATQFVVSAAQSGVTLFNFGPAPSRAAIVSAVSTTGTVLVDTVDLLQNVIDASPGKHVKVVLPNGEGVLDNFSAEDPNNHAAGLRNKPFILRTVAKLTIIGNIHPMNPRSSVFEHPGRMSGQPIPDLDFQGSVIEGNFLADPNDPFVRPYGRPAVNYLALQIPQLWKPGTMPPNSVLMPDIYQIGGRAYTYAQTVTDSNNKDGYVLFDPDPMVMRARLIAAINRDPAQAGIIYAAATATAHEDVTAEAQDSLIGSTDILLKITTRGHDLDSNDIPCNARCATGGWQEPTCVGGGPTDRPYTGWVAGPSFQRWLFRGNVPLGWHFNAGDGGPDYVASADVITAAGAVAGFGNFSRNFLLGSTWFATRAHLVAAIKASGDGTYAAVTTANVKMDAAAFLDNTLVLTTRDASSSNDGLSGSSSDGSVTALAPTFSGYDPAAEWVARWNMRQGQRQTNYGGSWPIINRVATKRLKTQWDETYPWATIDDGANAGLFITGCGVRLPKLTVRNMLTGVRTNAGASNLAQINDVDIGTLKSSGCDFPLLTPRATAPFHIRSLEGSHGKQAQNGAIHNGAYSPGELDEGELSEGVYIEVVISVRGGQGSVLQIKSGVRWRIDSVFADRCTSGATLGNIGGDPVIGSITLVRHGHEYLAPGVADYVHPFPNTVQAIGGAVISNDGSRNRVGTIIDKLKKSSINFPQDNFSALILRDDDNLGGSLDFESLTIEAESHQDSPDSPAWIDAINMPFSGKVNLTDKGPGNRTLMRLRGKKPDEGTHGVRAVIGKAVGASDLVITEDASSDNVVTVDARTIAGFNEALSFQRLGTGSGNICDRPDKPGRIIDGATGAILADVGDDGRGGGGSIDVDFASFVSSLTGTVSADNFQTAMQKLYSGISKPVTLLGARDGWNFVSQTYCQAGIATGTLTALPGYSYSRSGPGSALTAANVLVGFGPNVPRITNAGCIFEQSATNFINNGEATGGTPPLNWLFPSFTGLTVTPSSGFSDGRNYRRFHIFGTAGSSADSSLEFCDKAHISAVSGNTVTQALDLRLVAGSFSGLNSIKQELDEATVTGSSVAIRLGPDIKGSIDGAWRRPFFTQGLGGGATVERVRSRLYFKPTNAAAIDFTIDVSSPGTRLGSRPLSYIPTSGLDQTRGDDLMAMTGVPLPAQFTVYAEVDMEAVGGTIQTLGQWSDGTDNNRIGLRRNASDAAEFIIVRAGSIVFTATVAAKGGARRLRMALSFDGTSLYTSVDGAAPVVATAPTLPMVTTLVPARSHAGEFGNGVVRAFLDFDSPKTGPALQALGL